MTSYLYINKCNWVCGVYQNNCCNPELILGLFKEQRYEFFFADCVQKHNAEIVFEVFKPHFPVIAFNFQLDAKIYEKALQGVFDRYT